MPLSEQEQRLLDEMERHLLRNDADVVSAPTDARSLSYRNVVYGALGVLVGIGALIAGVALGQGNGILGVVVGVVGFAIMLGGVILAVTPAKNAVPRLDPDRPTPATSAAPGGASFMDRMNDRWDRRNDER